MSEVEALKKRVAKLEDALKPFAVFWSARKPLSADAGDGETYCWAPSKENSTVRLLFGDFRRAWKVFDAPPTP